MGEAKRKKSATQKLIEKFPDCCLCGGLRPSSTRDHIPPISLFDRSIRPDGLVVPACDDCNRSTSTADLVASLISRWRYDPEEAELRDHRRFIGRLRVQAPDVIDELIRLPPGGRIAARRHLRRQGVHVPPGSGMVSIGPITIRHLNLFAHKVVLGLHFDRLGSGLPAHGRVCAYWRTKEDYQRGGVPQELVDMLPKHRALQQGSWNTRKVFEYRYDLNPEDGLFACLARFRASLFVAGFAIRDEKLIQEDDKAHWISPTHLLDILTEPAFERRP